MMMILVEGFFGYIDIEEVALAVNMLCSLPSPRCKPILGNGGSLIQSRFLEIFITFGTPSIPNKLLGGLLDHSYWSVMSTM